VSKINRGLIVPFLLIILTFTVDTAIAGEKKNMTTNPMPSSAEDIRPLLIGSKVPRLTLTAVDGKVFDFNAAVAARPTILVFYRGGW